MKRLKTLVVWVLLVAVFLFCYQAMTRPETRTFRRFADFQDDVERGEVARVDLTGAGGAEVELRGGLRYRTMGELDQKTLTAVIRQGGAVSQGRREGTDSSLWIIAAVAVAVLAFFFLVLRRAGAGQFSSMTSFLKTRARVLPDRRTATFADVGGCAEAKELLRDLVDFLGNPGRWAAAGARVPRGILLEGPPGCGKTLLARALAGEAKAKLFFASGSEFVELFVGVGAARVRDTFETAAKEGPAVIFVDEIDAVGRHRGSGIGGSHDEREQTLNQLLVCLDGLQAYDRVVVVAASNRSDILDEALLRPGRFDRRVHIQSPARAERLEILRIHTAKKPLAPDVSLDALAEATDGMNGADLEAVANEAAIASVRRARAAGSDAPRITAEDFRAGVEQHRKRRGGFDCLDALLIGSSTQVSQPPGRALARLVLTSGGGIEGELLWANAEYMKVRRSDDGTELVVPKAQVKSLEALNGTAPAEPIEAHVDPWGARPPGVA